MLSWSLPLPYGALSQGDDNRWEEPLWNGGKPSATLNAVGGLRGKAGGVRLPWSTGQDFVIT